MGFSSQFIRPVSPLNQRDYNGSPLSTFLIVLRASHYSKKFTPKKFQFKDVGVILLSLRGSQNSKVGHRVCNYEVPSECNIISG